ncbi:MAG: hypothetical protein Q7R54_03205 [bacterium]|nr:hypothetical protein [bacterium]
MTDRKITPGSFERGPLRKIMNKQARLAHVSPQGLERVEAALKAGVGYIEKKKGLQYGVGDKYVERLVGFPTSKKYKGRRDPKLKLKPQELKAMEGSLNVFFKTKPPEPAAEMKVEPRKFVPKIEHTVEPKVMPRVALKSPEPPEQKKAA